MCLPAASRFIPDDRYCEGFSDLSWQVWDSLIKYLLSQKDGLETYIVIVTLICSYRDFLIICAILWLVGRLVIAEKIGMKNSGLFMGCGNKSGLLKN